MSKCFIIQPFDSGGRFDKRFNDIYKPAIEEVGLEPYRVDEDPTVDIPIDAIEEGIRDATMCLADITTDNPNVWYELGYAYATGCPVILVCSSEREGEGFPFDIQHRSIIQYGPESKSDFENLENAIIERAKALLDRAATRKFIQSEKVAPQEGLSQVEILLLATLAGEGTLPGTPVSQHRLEQMAEDSGMTLVGLGLAIRRLLKKEFIKIYEEGNSYYDEDYNRIVVLTDAGWNWIDENDDIFRLEEDGDDDDDNDLPF